MLEAIQAVSLPIISIRAASLDTAVAILTALISEAVLYFNLGNNMTPAQIRVTVDLIIADDLAKNLKPEDYRVLFNNAKKGLYGKVFNRIDGQVIFEWIHAYATERMDFIEQNNIKDHAAKKKDNLIAPEVVELYKEILKLQPVLEEKIVNISLVEKDGKMIYQGDKVKIKEEKPKDRIITKSPRDIYIQKVLTDFYNLWLAKPFIPPIPKAIPGTTVNNHTSGRFISFDGNVVDEIRYLKIKMIEYDQL